MGRTWPWLTTVLALANDTANGKARGGPGKAHPPLPNGDARPSTLTPRTPSATTSPSFYTRPARPATADVTAVNICNASHTSAQPFDDTSVLAVDIERLRPAWPGMRPADECCLAASTRYTRRISSGRSRRPPPPRKQHTSLVVHKRRCSDRPARPIFSPAPAVAARPCIPLIRPGALPPCTPP